MWYLQLDSLSIKCKFFFSNQRASFFGLLIVFSFCDFKFIRDNFLFLKTVTGRGIFDIFVMFMFLVAEGSATVFSYIVMGALGVCGVFFIIAGTVLKKDVVGADINSSQTMAKASMTGAGLTSSLV